MSLKETPTTIQIYKCIKKHGPIGYLEIADKTGYHRNTVSKYVRSLNRNGFVKNVDVEYKEGIVKHWSVTGPLTIQQDNDDKYTKYRVILVKDFENPDVDDSYDLKERISLRVSKSEYEVFKERVLSDE